MTRWTRSTLILSLILAVVVTGVTPRLVFAQGEAPVAPMTEAQFIELAGAEKPGDKSGQEPGRPHIPAKGTEEPKGAKKEESAGEGEGDGADSGEGDEGSGDDGEGDGDEGEGEGAGEGDDAGEGAGSADDGEDGEGDGEGGDDGAGDGEDDADEGEGAEGARSGAKDKATLDAEFQAALEAEGASPSLEDIPEEARPIVAKKLRDLEGGFTRAMQGLRADQKAAVSFRAEERFRKEKPVDFIVSMLLEKPEIAEGVNQRIEELEGNSTAVEGHKALVEKARADAAKAEEGELAKGRANEEKIERIVKLGRAAARAAGVPFDMGVEEGIAARVALDGDISEDEIRKIANAKASIYKKKLRESRRDRSDRYVRDKVADRKKAGLRVKPGQGSAPAPGARKMAKNDDEFIAEFSARA